MAEARETYTDPITDSVLRAAEALSQGVYELDPTVPPPLQAACRGLADAVYDWHESLDLQDELAGEGVRAGVVVDPTDPAYAMTYAASVERVLSAALVVRSSALGEPRVEDARPVNADAEGFPESGRPLLRDLDEAVEGWGGRPDVAAQWRERGLRSLWLDFPAASLKPDPPEAPPPGARATSKSTPVSADVGAPRPGSPSGSDDGGDTAARLAPEASQPAPPTHDSAAARRPDPAVDPHCVGVSRRDAVDRRIRQRRASDSAAAARHRGAVAR